MKNLIDIIREEYNYTNYLRWKRQNVTIRGIQEMGKENNGMASFGQGLYTAALGNKELARKYGKVYFVVGAIPKHPKIVNTWNDAEIFIQKVVMLYGKEKGMDDYFDAKRDFDVKTNVKDEMLKLGYDGLIIRGREMVNYTPPDNIRYFSNENELMNYFEYNIQSNLNEERLHTLNDAKTVLNLIQNNISRSAELIGGFGKGKTSSMHDIDILIPDKDVSIKDKLMQLLAAESVEGTDWGGLYYNNTPYGDVDIFFSTEEFDY